MNKFTKITHYTKTHVKAHYGRYGRQSGINPGVMWPRKEELEHMKQYEQAFCPKLEDLVAENEAKKQQEFETRRAREQEVYKKMQTLPQEFKNFFDKIEKKSLEKQKWLEEREALVEEVREILGFRAKPSDERFQEALQKKEEEEDKAKRKELRKQRENAGLDEMLGQAKKIE